MYHDCGCRLDSKKQLQSSQGLLSSWSVQAAIAGYIQLVLPSGSSSPPPTTSLPTSHFLFLSVPYTSVGKGSRTELYPQFYLCVIFCDHL